MRLTPSPSSLYNKAVLDYPLITLIAVCVIVGLIIAQARHFQLDASSDSLVLENDPDLRYYRLTRGHYGSDDYLIITYTSSGELFADASLARIKALRDDLLQLERVDSVVSILDAPLFQSPPVSLFAMGKDFKTLEMDSVDKDLAIREFQESPLYTNLLLSEDGETTALQVNFVKDTDYQELIRRQDWLRDKKFREGLTGEESTELARISNDVREANTRLLARQQQDVEAIRGIIAKHSNRATLFLGGIPMIIVDMIAYVKNDLVVFGAGVIVFMAITLSAVFRRPRWVLMPLGISLLAGFTMVGYLALVDWRVTVISSNFFSLMMIMTIAVIIHLVVRYRELQADQPDASQRELVADTVHSMARPCFYTTLTTMVAFGSLIVSGIRPVIDFGWMMTIGVGIGFVLAFLIFPASLMLLTKTDSRLYARGPPPLTHFFAELTVRHGGKILALSALVMLASLAGLFRLSVENRFTDYFRKSTDIYQGLAAIDQRLGGTTPLEVILDGYGEDYWNDPTLRDSVAEMHEYLERLSETGKVLSMATFMGVAEQVNDDFPLDNFYLNLVYKQMPDDIRARVFDPYASRSNDQIRFALRVRETDPDLRRQALIDKIRGYFVNEAAVAGEELHITGMLVLYNNMLQSLFRSQILTLGAVFLAIMLMFFIAFRSIALAAIAIVPNVFPAVLVLGAMGWLGVSLDMMTITIAAIAVGIGVHDTIHYMHRYREEFAKDHDYVAAVRRSHATIGRAIYYTSLTITVGFSILALSNFIPTIYFGLFTGFAMVVAVLADLTVLPRLLILFKPLGAEAETRGIMGQ